MLAADKTSAYPTSRAFGLPVHFTTFLTMSRERVKGFIRPRDPYQQFHCPHKTWSRYTDCFTGRGPDIFVGCLNSYPHRPSKPEWSVWGQDRNARHDPAPVYGTRRRDDRYNFRTRRYRPWSEHMWSDVEYSDFVGDPSPLGYRDAFFVWYFPGVRGRPYWDDRHHPYVYWT
jgi:hypothetical protein